MLSAKILSVVVIKGEITQQYPRVSLPPKPNHLQ